MVSEQVADTKSVTIPAGHFTMIEEPEATNAEIARFTGQMGV
jgi:pimeloyl-ACP methyl ester carboxylesterase